MTPGTAKAKGRATENQAVTTCTEWKGYTSNGYGRVRVDGCEWRVHRLIMQLAGHDIEGRVVMHTCDNPICFNIEHLRAGTQLENIADMLQKGRGANPPHCPGMKCGRRKLTDDDVRDIRARYATGTISQRSLASEYGVTQPNIGRIVREETWKGIK